MMRSTSSLQFPGLPLPPTLLAMAASFIVFTTSVFDHARASTPSPTHSGFIGAWRLTFETPLGPSESLLTIMPGGTLLFSGQAVKPASEAAPVTFISAAHGVWEETGARTGAMTWIGMVSDAEGNLLAIVTDSAQATLSPDGNTWEGVYQAAVADPSGNVLYEGNGTVRATRITVQLPATPRATPATG